MRLENLSSVSTSSGSGSTDDLWWGLHSDFVAGSNETCFFDDSQHN